MNKNKRALMSMIVFLSVFCLSAIFKIPNNATTKEYIPNGSEAQEITEPETTVIPSTNDNEIESFSYNTNSIVTAWENSYMVTESSAETTDIQENTVSTDHADTSAKAEVSTVGAGEDAVAEEPQANHTKELTQEAALYANIGISIAKEYVNIRDKASTDSEVLGKLYKNSAVEILETSGDWYHVESGSVKGYVKAEFIRTGIPDEELVENYGEPSIVVAVEGLNVREKADTESDKVTVIYQNEIYPVLDSDDEWIKINIPEDKTAGYVKSEYAELMIDFKDAISKEEEEELLKLQAEERAKKETEIKRQDSVSYSQEELRLLACLVHSEAGTQSYEGKLAVANVVLNRVKSSKYGGSIKSVIYQPGQFSVAKSGSLAKQLSNYDNYSSRSQQLSIKAAKAALEGSNNIGSRLYFHSYKAAVRKGYDKKKTSVKLGDHLFW
jgi:spore germination cell wall hydrolase CwlJ-like protein